MGLKISKTILFFLKIVEDVKICCVAAPARSLLAKGIHNDINEATHHIIIVHTRKIENYSLGNKIMSLDEKSSLYVKGEECFVETHTRLMLVLVLLYYIDDQSYDLFCFGCMIIFGKRNIEISIETYQQKSTS